MRYMSVLQNSAVAFVILAIFGAGSEAQTYKLTDRKGDVSYTDAPTSRHAPLNSKAEKMNGELQPSGVANSEKSDILYIAPLKARGFGYCVDAVVNGDIRLNMLVDTGASFTILAVSAASRLGVTNLEELPRMPVSTAGGVTWIYLVELESVKVGEAEAVSIEGGVSDQVAGGLDGLLGMSFLGEFVYQVDGPGEKMSLKPQPGADTKGGVDNAWWLAKRNRYVENIRRFTALKENLDTGKPIDDPELKKTPGFTSENAGKIIAFYTRMLNSLDRKTAAAGSPANWRVYP